ncbi:hypothetical protein X734_17595 [Mesorhizobium sp. L2C084A000]|nr:hypothetical protein X734_17595 [Mesorhizobium sp. L2C084A000]
MGNGFKRLVVSVAHYLADDAPKLFEIFFGSMSLNIT